MKDIKIYIPCCDASLDIVKINSYLFSKFWPDAQVVYLGFSEPEFDFYNKNHSFHSLADKQEGGAQKWTRYLYDFFKELEEEIILFSIDDYLLCKEPSRDQLEIAVKFIKNNKNIGRFDLTFDSQVEGEFLKLNVESIKDFTLLVKKPDAGYRISTQPALWKKDYLLNFLNNDWSPWEFELKGTLLAKNAGFKEQTFAFYDEKMHEYPIRTIAKGLVSRYNPGKYNVLGLKPSTIKELIDKNFFREEELIWGQWQGKVPSFKELGGYSFYSSLLPLHEASKTNWKEYELIYKEPEKVNLFDRCFSHTMQMWGYVSSNGNNNWGRPKTIQYVLNKKVFEGTTIFTDHFLKDRSFINSIQSKKKVAWICEPPAIHPWSYEYIENTHDLFDLILTYDFELANKYTNCKLVNIPGTLLKPENCKIHKKIKLTSLIAANKKISIGHRYRFEIAEKLSSRFNIDLWGSAFRKFDDKEQALKDYCFSITVHNCKIKDFYTEAIVDCFLAGTVPIFWGCPNIDEYFDPNGIISFDTIEELEEIMKNLSFDLYQKMLPYIKINFEIAKKHQEVQDDQIYKIIKREIYDD